MIRNAEELHRERLRRGLSLREVARRAGLPNETVCAIERVASPEVIAKISAVIEAAPVRFEIVGDAVPREAERVICA
jgi:transcriptional regulator with XRE-family HTH domain